MTEERIREEEARIRAFRRVTDTVCETLRRAPITLPEARDLERGLRRVAGRLFPGKESVFDLVIAPRLRRIVRSRFVIDGEKR